MNWSSSIEGMARMRMPEPVRRNLLLDSGPISSVPHYVSYHLRSEKFAFPLLRPENVFLFTCVMGSEFKQFLKARLRNDNLSELVTLSSDPKLPHPLLSVLDIFPFKRAQLRDSQSPTIK